MKKLIGIAMVGTIIGSLIGLTCWGFWNDGYSWWWGLVIWLGCFIVALLLIFGVLLIGDN